MAAQNRTKQILGEPAEKAIASRPMEEVYRLITEAGVYLACAGFLDSANELLANLWSYKLNHSRNVWLADRAMTVLWHHAGRHPAAIPFAMAEIDSVELEHRRYMTGNRWSDVFLQNTADDPRSLAIKRLTKAMIASYPRKAGPMPPKAKDLEALADFAIFADSEFCLGYNAFSALTNLVELCAKHGTLVFGKLSWHQLLEKISKKAIAQKKMPFSKETKTAKWLGRPQASMMAIDEAVKQLGTSIPGDYRSFLLVADGFQAVSRTSVNVFGIGEVRWLRDAMPDLLKAWNGSAVQEIHRALEQSLLIGDYNGEQQLLLVPSESHNHAASWECWFFASWIPGEDRDPSFRAYMEKMLLELQGEDES